MREDLSSVMRNFLVFCFAFSINISCVISCLSYATSILGHLLGGYGGGVLYVFSAFTALFCSNPAVSTMGPRSSLLVGMGFYCIYVGGFLLAVITHQKWPILGWVSFLTGSMFGGMASGVVWTAQGRYLSLNVFAYSTASSLEDTNSTQENVTNRFAGIFACIFLGTEFFLRSFASVMFLATHDVVFSLYGTMTLLSFLLMAQVDDMGEEGTWVVEWDKAIKDSSSALLLAYRDVRMLCMIPFQLCVGLAFSFVPFYVFGTIIADSDNLGSAYVGLISACIPLTGSAIAFPTASIASKYGKPLPMTVGAIGLASTGLAIIIFSDETLGTWPYVMTYIIVYGIGRGVYENTNKAVFIEYFGSKDGISDTVTSAFAGANFARNFASAFGYFAFNYIRRLDMALLILLSAFVGIVSYYVAHYRSVLLSREGGSGDVSRQSLIRS